MSSRAFQYFAIQAGGTPQPLIGTWLTGSVNPSPQNAANRMVQLPVNSSTPFVKGDYILIQTKTGTNLERTTIFSVDDATHITVFSLLLAHTGGVFGTGEMISLDTAGASVKVQGKDGNTGDLFVGLAPTMVTGTGVQCIWKVVKVAAAANPNSFVTGSDFPDNADSVGQLWIDGTTNDLYLPSYRTT